MILTKDEIVEEIKKKNVVIAPFNPKAIGPSSIDLTLDNIIRVFERIDSSVPVNEVVNYKDITRKVRIDDRYVIKPGELILGITKEKITLPTNMCGWLNSRSKFARLGLMVHATAPFVQPGISNKQVLEIYNAGPNNLELIPGQRLCQIILQRCEGNAKYQGKFKKQTL